MSIKEFLPRLYGIRWELTFHYSFWAFLYVQNRFDICKFISLMKTFHLANNVTVPVQNYITAIVVFLIVEQLMTWGFYSMIYPVL